MFFSLQRRRPEVAQSTVEVMVFVLTAVAILATEMCFWVALKQANRSTGVRLALVKNVDPDSEQSSEKSSLTIMLPSAWPTPGV